MFAQQAFHDSLIVEAEEVLYENPKKTIHLLKGVLLSGNEDQVFDACSLIGDAYYLLGDFPKSELYYGKAEQLAEADNNQEKLAKAYMGLGTVYSDNGRTDAALDYLFKSLTIRELQGDKIETANVLNNIAVLYHKQGKGEDAIEFMHRVNQIDKETGDSLSLGYSYSNLGAFHYHEGNNDSALFYHNLALDVRTALNDDFQRSRTLNNIANVLVDMGQVSEATKVYKNSIKLRRELGNQFELALGLNNFGEALLGADMTEQAFPYLLEAHNILDSLNNLTMALDNSEFLAKAYSQKGDYKSAYEFMRLAFSLRKDVFDEKRSEQTQEMMAKFETEQTKKENEALRAKRAEDSLDLEKSKNKSYLLIGGMLILGLLAFMIFTKLRTNKKVTVKLKALYNQLEESNTSILDSINYAKRIQSAILPPINKIKEKLPNVFVYYQPKDVVAGDFYWFKSIENKIMIAAADCTGHGVPGALVSVVCSNALNRSVHEHGLHQPADLLNQTRKIVESEFGESAEKVNDGMDIALCVLEGRSLKYAGAHNPLWVVRKGVFENEKYTVYEHEEYSLLEIKADKQPVGKFEKSVPFTQHQIELKQGDLVYLFSDGFIDQFGGERNKKFKSANFRKLIFKAQKQDEMEGQKTFMKEVFNDWKGRLEQLDDICVIGFRID